MTIVLPKAYETQEALRERGIPSITEEQGLREDIRALRIGILNMLACDQDHEADLLHPMGRSVMQIEPIWIRLKTHEYADSDADRVKAVYRIFEDVVADGPLDGLVLTGVSTSDASFKDLPSWPEITRILRYARNNVTSTLGISWGAQVLAAFAGIPSESYDEPLFGVFKARNLNETHLITCVMDDVFDCPIHRLSGVANETLKREQEKGELSLLAETQEAGVLLAETTDNRFIMHFGHPEYDTQDIIAQHLKDKQQYGNKAIAPGNFSLDKPVNSWRGHRTALFTQWIKYIHETRSY